MPGVEEETRVPGPWPPDKGVLEAAKLLSSLPTGNWLRRKGAGHTYVPLRPSVCVCRANALSVGPGARAVRRGGSDAAPEVGVRAGGCDPAHGGGNLCPRPGAPSVVGVPARPRLRAIPAGFLASWCGPTPVARGLPGGPPRRVEVSHKTPHWIASELGLLNSLPVTSAGRAHFGAPEHHVTRPAFLPLRLLRRPWLPRPGRPGLPALRGVLER